VDSGHASSTHFCAQLTHDKDLIGVEENVHPSQDLHVIISYVPKDLKESQQMRFT